MSSKKKRGNSTLHEAASEGLEVIVRKLVESGANVDGRDEDGDTPLHNASSKGHEEAVVVLLSAKANPNLRNKYGDTPLHQAAQNGNEGIAKRLLAAGANATLKNKNGMTPLHMGVGGEGTMASLLVSGGAEVNSRNNNGETALHICTVQNCSDAVVAKLLTLGAEVNAQDKNLFTALHHATVRGNFQSMKRLVDAKADVTLRNKDGVTSGAATKAAAEMSDDLRTAQEQIAVLEVRIREQEAQHAANMKSIQEQVERLQNEVKATRAQGQDKTQAELKAAYEKIVRLESNTLDFESELRQARIALTLEIERKQAAQGPRAAATPTRKWKRLGVGPSVMIVPPWVLHESVFEPFTSATSRDYGTKAGDNGGKIGHKAEIKWGSLRGVGVSIIRLKREDLRPEREILRVLDVMLATLHPTITPLAGVSWDDNFQYLITPLLPGYTLHTRLQMRNDLVFGWEERISVGLVVAQALAYLHSVDEGTGRAGIVHGGLSADSVVFDMYERARVCHFGIHHMLASEARRMEPLGYTDPDYFKRGEFLAEHDCYSMGVIFIQLVTGHPTAFEGSKTIAERYGDNLRDPSKMGEVPIDRYAKKFPAATAGDMVLMGARLMGLGLSKSATGSAPGQERMTAAQAATKIKSFGPCFSYAEDPYSECVCCCCVVPRVIFECGHELACEDCARLMKARGDSCLVCGRKITVDTLPTEH